MARNRKFQTKLIYELSQEEYLQGANSTLNNAENILKFLKYPPSSEENFSIKISLMISSLEELSKAMVLKIKAVDKNISIHKFDAFFYNHLTKHTATHFFGLWALVKSLEDLSVSKEFEKKFNKFIESLPLTGIAVLGLLGLIVWSISRNQSDKKNNKQSKVERQPKNDYSNLYQKVDLEKFRQGGLYVDFDEKIRKWIIPKENFNIENYQDAIDMTEFLFDIIRINVFSDNFDNKQAELIARDLSNIISEVEKENKENRKAIIRQESES